jgi:hypothetical protein
LCGNVVLFEGRNKENIKDIVNCTCEQNVLNTRPAPGKQSVLDVENVAARHVQNQRPEALCGEAARMKMEVCIT